MNEQISISFFGANGHEVISAPPDSKVEFLKDNGNVSATVTLKRNGAVLKDNDTLNDGDLITALPNYKGGR